MTQVTIDAGKSGLGLTEIGHSFGIKREVGEFNKDISQVQPDAQRKFSGATRDIDVLQKLDKSKSEDGRTLERLEDKYGTGFGSIDPDYQGMRAESIVLVISPEADQVTLTAGTELEIIEKYPAFIEDLTRISTKIRKQKFKNGDLGTDAIAEIAKKLAFTILNVKEDSGISESDKKSDSVENK